MTTFPVTECVLSPTVTVLGVGVISEDVVAQLELEVGEFPGFTVMVHWPPLAANVMPLRQAVDNGVMDASPGRSVGKFTVLMVISLLE